MLPLDHQIAFVVYACLTLTLGGWGFYRLYKRVRRGRRATDARFDAPLRRLGYALLTTLTQSRTFRDRPRWSTFHAFIFYGFVFYLLVNVVDALEGFTHVTVRSTTPLGALYNLLADVLSLLVLVGVAALALRRFFLTERRDFRFGARTPLHERVRAGMIPLDSAVVSLFIFVHVGSRALAQGAKLHGERDLFQPFSSLLAGLFTPASAEVGLIVGYWGALGSILAFLAYFPYSKHLHIFAAPAKYFVHREGPLGALPPLGTDIEAALEAAAETGETPPLGAAKLEDLAWPRLLDAYACIQCNRCQDVCPASATGKALSPAALEINKRMELNALAGSPLILKEAPFEAGAPSPRPLLSFALSPEALWACTTCGACMQVCPVEDEQMLDIIDIRRHQVMVAGEVPAPLTTAFRGMERSSNPWGISRDARLAWAEGLKVPTVAENPNPDVLYWVGCAAAYDPSAQRTARAFVQLLEAAGVSYAVLGKSEGCTGDAARRAGNEYLYETLARSNIAALDAVKPKRIVATCPHCFNALANDYPQLGGHYRVTHHTAYLEELLASGALPVETGAQRVTYHDPCYLGRHNGVYDAPRELIRRLAGEVLELERSREGSFCCGAGGAQFWKEEEPGGERVSDNRFREIQRRLDEATARAAAAERGEKVLAVGCPFCKSMLASTPSRAEAEDVAIKDVAELLLERVPGLAAASGAAAPRAPEAAGVPNLERTPPENLQTAPTGAAAGDRPAATSAVVAAKAAGERPARKPWRPKGQGEGAPAAISGEASAPPERKVWKPKRTEPDAAPRAEGGAEAPKRKAWRPKASSQKGQPAPDAAETPQAEAAEPDATEPDAAGAAAPRKKWRPKTKPPSDA
ncbi:(Fe-S)-binding protein [Truepera radiovictrix]|uniref:4Fe-4S ferredoxin-type domain-containing protein n=1 Tax=Truepera radiovictrix (strain DSM 17093 / CIP 108686 / LMG 22925 / RQ-24) TaxID=649638 RepID=D7CXW1_TRURR|nr:(Fe-S)-binding protein [Truepera radiovictrix]ADI13321.1 protein of unknown function DUF224 cysteine-rich region domain protein [Truepera radiovictrix DSM 17093]WMT58114.1 heterodisulfide reductase-related iron-sulfur binding cluster [Truepera radiovictrix]